MENMQTWVIFSIHLDGHISKSAVNPVIYLGLKTSMMMIGM